MIDKEYNILVIDDLDDIETVFMVLKEELAFENYKVNFHFTHEAKEDLFDMSKAYDILLFDCNFSGSNLIKYKENGVVDRHSPNTVGFSLIKKFRETNHRTKIIFYSSFFNEEEGRSPLSNKEFFLLINELNVFKVIEKNPYKIEKAIKDAINDLDLIMVCLDEVYREYIDEEVTYELNGNQIKIKDLLHQFHTGGAEAEKFRKNVLESSVQYLLKFKY